MPAQTSPLLSSTKFAAAFESYCQRVESESGEPFKDFGSGLPDRWEGYKEWVYHAARMTLACADWKPAQIGSGSILKKTIEAIELHESKTYRNNLVQWDARFGDDSRAHARLRDAQKDKKAAKMVEQVLFDFYRSKISDQKSFQSMLEVVGSRYDVIAYLFFLKDWTTYMPVRPGAFSEAFERLGMPYAMSGQCSWENYSGFLTRLTIVQTELAAYGVPGNRLIDAHSFCWMLARLPDAKRKQHHAVRWIFTKPQAVNRRQVQSPHGKVSAPIDFSAIEEARRQIGALAQLRVLEAEIERLTKAGRSDLAKKVEDVSANASLGYDISSFGTDGSDKFIEVKAAAARGSAWRFFLSENERNRSLNLKGYVFALVQDLDLLKPTIWEFPGDQLPADSLRPMSYEVIVKAP